MVTKYRGLRIITWFIGGVVLGLIFALTPTPVLDYSGSFSMMGAPAIALGIVVFLASIVITILLEGFAELLTVFMDTEENTRLQTTANP